LFVSKKLRSSVTVLRNPRERQRETEREEGGTENMPSAEAEVSVEQGVYEVLGERARDVDSTILEYIVNVLKDETFDFGRKGEEAFEAVGLLLVNSNCVNDEHEARTVRLLSLLSRVSKFLYLEGERKSRIESFDS
jgi:hypothetical protein